MDSIKIELLGLTTSQCTDTESAEFQSHNKELKELKGIKSQSKIYLFCSAIS